VLQFVRYRTDLPIWVPQPPLVDQNPQIGLGVVRPDKTQQTRACGSAGTAPAFKEDPPARTLETVDERSKCRRTRGPVGEQANDCGVARPDSTVIGFQRL
jgi:hypothetical protein